MLWVLGCFCWWCRKNTTFLVPLMPAGRNYRNLWNHSLLIWGTVGCSHITSVPPTLCGPGWSMWAWLSGGRRSSWAAPRYKTSAVLSSHSCTRSAPVPDPSQLCTVRTNGADPVPTGSVRVLTGLMWIICSLGSPCYSHIYSRTSVFCSPALLLNNLFF